jgi:hypothetical protein
LLLNFAATYGSPTVSRGDGEHSGSRIVDAQASQNMLVIPGTFPPRQQRKSSAPWRFHPGASINPYLDSAVRAGAVNRVNASFGAWAPTSTAARTPVSAASAWGAKACWARPTGVSSPHRRSSSATARTRPRFAGSNSPSILPRLIGQIHAAKHLNLHADIGEEHDFEVNELSRFIWNTGVSVPITNATFDIGVGGSKFDEPIQWTPVTATGGDGVTITAANPPSTQLGTNYIDFLFGVKVRLFEGMVLGGAVNVPITSDGFSAPPRSARFRSSTTSSRCRSAGSTGGSPLPVRHASALPALEVSRGPADPAAPDRGRAARASR